MADAFSKKVVSSHGLDWFQCLHGNDVLDFGAYIFK